MEKRTEIPKEMQAMVDLVRSTPHYCHFNENVIQSAEILKDSLSRFITDANVDLTSNELLNQTKEIIVMSKNPLHTFHMLHKIRKYDDTTFVHSLNVAILCNLFGQWTEMPQEDLDILTLAGLLHDVGKMNIPEEIIKKPGTLTEEEYSVVKNHPRRGYAILENLPLDERIKKVALMHHERCDGSGYPDGIQGGEIIDFAKIVAIADVYDALTSARVYRGPLCPFEVIHMIEKEDENKKYDPRFLYPFLEGVVKSFVGFKVILSDGREGKIIESHRQNFAHPIIQVGNEQIDLMHNPDLTIQSLA